MKKYLAKKEEISLNMFNNTTDEEYFSYDYWDIGTGKTEKEDNGYYIIYRNIFLKEHKEKEFWFKYHLSTIKQLKYSEDEIKTFLYNARDYPLANDELISINLRTNNSEENIKLVTEKLLEPNRKYFDLSSDINFIKRHYSEFRTTEEYLNLMEKLIFQNKHMEFIKEYIEINPKWRDKEKEIQTNIEDIINSKKYSIIYMEDMLYVLNIIYFEAKEKEKLMKNLEIICYMEDFLKYEEFLLEDYPERLEKLLMELLKDFLRISSKNDYAEIISYMDHLQNYPKWRENVKDLKRYYRANYTNSYQLIRAINKHYNKEKKLV